MLVGIVKEKSKDSILDCLLNTDRDSQLLVIHFVVSRGDGVANLGSPFKQFSLDFGEVYFLDGFAEVDDHLLVLYGEGFGFYGQFGELRAAVV